MAERQSVAHARGRRRTRVAVAAAAIGALALAPTVAPAYGDATALAGGGESTGTIEYVGKPLPGVDERCAQKLSFTLGTLDDPTAGWQSDAFVLSAPDSRYVGPVRITGGGGSGNGCESYFLGGGVMTMELSGFNPLTGASLACNTAAGDSSLSGPVSGHYTRVGSDLRAVVTGRCLVNGTPTGQVTFTVDVQAVPRDAATGEGVTRAVRSMATSGVFVRS